MDANSEPKYRTRTEVLTAYPTEKHLYIFEKNTSLYGWIIMYASTMITDVKHYIKDNNINEYEKFCEDKITNHYL